MSRRAPAAMLAVALAACGDDPAATAPAPPPAAAPGAASAGPAPAAEAPRLPPGPPEAVLDDEGVLAAVVAASAAGGTFPSDLGAFPPRVSPVRVGVRALHDHLLGVRDAATTWDGLLAALGALARRPTHADGAALAPLVEAWRGWSASDREAEGALAERTTRALDLLRAEGAPDRDGLARLLTAPPRGPAKSPAAATLAALRAGHVVLAAKDAGFPPTAEAALRDARRAFDDLGWPGGLGATLDFVAHALSRSDDADARLRAAIVANAALEAYRASNDAVRAAQVLLDLAAGARRTNEASRAEALARSAEQALASAGARGSEVVDAAFFRVWTLQALGRHDDALAACDRILREIDAMKLDPAQRAPVCERKASSLFVLGRFDEALAAVELGAAAYDEGVRIEDPERERLRAGLDELAGECLTELGRGREGSARHLRAAERHAKLPGGRRAAAADRLLAARSLVRAGDRDGGLALVREVLGDVADAATRAHAASVLRDAGAIDDARRELDRAAAEGGEELARALIEERARLEVAAGRPDEARRHFAEAEVVAIAGAATGDGNPAGFAAARVVLDWARMEDAAGDVERARDLADRAVFHLSQGGLPLDGDRAQALYVATCRRLGAFADAERVTSARLARGVPGSAARREDARIDLFLVRLERAAAGTEEAAQRLAEALAELPKGPLREACAALAHPGGAPVPADDPKLPPRTRLLREAAALHDADPSELVAFARRTPVSEPELRRWALARAVTPREGVGARRIDPIEWSDLRRGAEPVTEARLRAALSEHEAFVLIEPVGAWTRVVWTTRDSGGDHVVPGDLRLPALWDAVHVERTADAVAAAAGGVMDAGLREILAAAYAAGARRLTFSVGQPYAPLPFELLPWAAGPERHPAFDVVEVAVAASASERVAAAARPDADADLEVLRSSRAPLTSRRALVAVAPGDASCALRFEDALQAALRKGLTVPLALRTAKEHLRDAAPADASADRGVPLWASFLLRGAW